MKCLRDKKMPVGRVVALVAALLLTCAVFPRVARADEGSVRIHVLNFYEDEDAILIESDGRFGMVDSGEDDDYPKGNDARYPYRSGTRVRKGHQDEVIAYLERMGVTSDNFEFYIGTHPHSDHIGSADDVIKTFKPQRVYSPDYKDSYLSDPWRLWDNLYIFDQMKAAAKKVGASFITNLSYDAPVSPGKNGVANPAFTLGSAQIEIVNWDNHELTAGAYEDCNDFSWGVVVSCGGRRAFLAGDINNYGGDEDYLSGLVGAVDVLKLGHHGCVGSNSEGFLCALQPGYAVVTGPFDNMPITTVDTLLELGAHIYCTPESRGAGKSAIVLTLSSSGVWADALADPDEMIFRVNCGSYDAVAFVDGAPANYSGTWTTSAGNSFTFSGSPYGTLNGSIKAGPGKWMHNSIGWWWKNTDGTYPKSSWQTIKGVQYYFNSKGYMLTGWLQDGGNWYYFDNSGALATGWRRVKGEWYYLDPSNYGAMVTGLFTVKSTRYVARPSGVCPTSGWVKVGRSWYLTSSSCALCTGWAKHDGTWYWLDIKTGIMATGWKKVKGVHYWLDSSGAMATGWRQLDGTWYWFNSSGAMQTGWKQIGRSWYWFDKNGAMLASDWTPDGYYVNKNGAWVKGKTRS